MEKESALPWQLMELADKIIPPMEKVVALLSDETIMQAWQELNAYKLYGHEDMLKQFDPTRLKADSQIFLATLLYFRNDMKDSWDHWCEADIAAEKWMQSEGYAAEEGCASEVELSPEEPAELIKERLELAEKSFPEDTRREN